MYSKNIYIFVVIFSLILMVSFLQAQAPQLLNYQGKLNTGGKPATGTFSITFSIYATATGGTALWSETHSNVSVTDGVFDVLLGSITSFPSTLFTGNGERYLGMKVGSDSEMTPRFRLSSVAFAVRASHADAVADNAVTSAKIKDQEVKNSDLANSAVTSSKIANGQVVTSINSLKDNVTLKAGNNISITPSGNTLTIAASISGTGGNTLDQAYDHGGSGAGRTITADAGAVNIAGTDGLTVSGQVTASSFSGNGSSLTSLIASNITSGTISDSRLESTIDRTRFNATDYITASGGIHVGGTSDPGTDNLIVDGTAQMQGFRLTTGAANGYVLTSNSSGVGFWKPAGSGTSPWSTSGNNIYYNAGNIGIGTTAPGTPLEIKKTGGFGAVVDLLVLNSNNAGLNGGGALVFKGSGSQTERAKIEATYQGSINGDLRFYTNITSTTVGLTEKMRITPDGNVGIGTTSPNYKLHVNGSAGKPGGGSWSNASDARLKDIKGNFTRGLEAIDKLIPVYFKYKKDNPINLPSDQEYIGLIAQEVQKVIPEAVGKYEKDYLSLNNDPIIWTMLNAIKELKAENAAMKQRIEALEQRLGTN